MVARRSVAVHHFFVEQVVGPQIDADKTSFGSVKPLGLLLEDPWTFLEIQRMYAGHERFVIPQRQCMPMESHPGTTL